MTTIGVDYSSTTASLALVKKKKVIEVATLKLLEDETAFLKLWQALLASWCYQHCIGGVNLVIEDSWSREGRFAWTALKLEHMKTLLSAGARLSGYASLTPILVLPMAWRKLIYGHGRPKDPKELAVITVQNDMGFKVPMLGKTGRGNKPDHNLAEACLLGMWGEITQPQ